VIYEVEPPLDADGLVGEIAVGQQPQRTDAARKIELPLARHRHNRKQFIYATAYGCPVDCERMGQKLQSHKVFDGFGWCRFELNVIDGSGFPRGSGRFSPKKQIGIVMSFMVRVPARGTGPAGKESC